MDDLISNLKNTGKCALKLLISAYFIGSKKGNLINCLIFDQKKMIEFNNLFLCRAILTDSTTSLRNLYISFFLN